MASYLATHYGPEYAQALTQLGDPIFLLSLAMPAARGFASAGEVTAASAARRFALGQLEGLGYGLLSTLAENPGATFADLVHASEQMLMGNLAIGALGHAGGQGWRRLAKGSEKPPDVPPSPAGEQVRNTGDLSPREIPPGNLDNPTPKPHNDISHGPPKPIPLDDALRFLQRVDTGTPGENAAAGRGGSANSTGDGSRRNTPAKLRDYASHGHTPIPEGWLGTLEPRQGGAEHQTFNDPAEPAWRIKVTGPALRFQDGTPRHLSEARYLQRLRLGNTVFGDQVEYLGVISTAQGDCIVTRQPLVEALDPENPYPTEPEIFEWLTRAGFERTPDHWQNWVRKADGLEIEDIHPGNFIQTPHGIRPIDVQLEQTAAAKAAGQRIIPWEETQAGQAEASARANSGQGLLTPGASFIEPQGTGDVHNGGALSKSETIQPGLQSEAMASTTVGGVHGGDSADQLNAKGAQPGNATPVADTLQSNDHTAKARSPSLVKGDKNRRPSEFVSISGTKIQIHPTKTTTIIGVYYDDMKNIIEDVFNEEKSVDFEAKPGGFNVLNIPNDLWLEHKDVFWEKINLPWLEKAINRGDIFCLATPPLPDYLFDQRSGRLTGFGMEYNHLKSKGYTYDELTRTMSPPRNN